MPTAKIWNQNPFNFHLKKGEGREWASWECTVASIWKWACSGILSHLGCGSSLFCEWNKNRCKSTSCQPDKAKTSVSLLSCVSWMYQAIRLVLHPAFLLPLGLSLVLCPIAHIYNPYPEMNDAANERVSRMCFDSILLLTCYSSPDICFSFHFISVTFLCPTGPKMNFCWYLYLISHRLELNDCPGWSRNLDKWFMCYVSIVMDINRIIQLVSLQSPPLA